MEKIRTEGPIAADRYKDPAMGMASFSRVSGHAKLFGSEITHDHYVTLTIRHGLVDRHLNQDWYFATNGWPIVEVSMSAAQFADLITNMNMGSGVPVTITQVDKETFKMPDFPSKAEQFKEELSTDLKEVMEKYSSLEKEVTDLLSKDKPLNKSEKAGLLAKATALSTFAHSHLPFLATQFSESMEKRTVEAKIEVENFVNSTVTRLGVDSLLRLAQIGKESE